MRYIDLQYSFELEINMIDANLVKPKSVDIEYWLNRGLEMFCKTRYTGETQNGLGFEGNQKRIDDLRTLICTRTYELDENSYYVLKEDGAKIKLYNRSYLLAENIPYETILATSTQSFALRLPINYMFLLGDRVGITPANLNDPCIKMDSDCNIVMHHTDTIESSIETVDRQLENSLSEHRWRYNKARPLRLMRNNLIELLTDGNYIVNEYTITYLRKPQEIDIHKRPYDEYTDMPEHTHSEIVRLAVQLFLASQPSGQRQEQ